MKELCPAEALHEECGVFGIYDSTGKTNMVSAVYSALYALQHRGQESCGIALNVDGVLTGYRDLGLVSEVFTPRVLADLPQDAKMATGHVRYATSGQRTRANAQPMVLHHCKGTMAICHNGNLTNAPQLRHKLEMNGSIFHGTSDTEVIGYLLTQNRLISPDIETAVCRTMEQIVGAYSLVIMTHTKLIAARDPNGFRPLCIGQLPDGSGWAFASESCALDAVGARFVRDVLPGEIVVADYTGLRTIRTHCGTAPHTMCVFEYIYFARPDSIIEGTCVHDARLQAGRFLTETTVAELKAQIKELQAKNAGYAEQLSLLQNQPPVAEVQAEEVDMDALRAEIRAEMKAEMESQRRADAKMTELNQKERDEAIKAARKAKEELEEIQRAAAAAKQAHAEELAKTRRQAEETAARLNMAADESTVRFGLLFDQLQDAAGKVLDLADAVQQTGETEKAGKFRAALYKALLALADEANGVQK